MFDCDFLCLRVEGVIYVLGVCCWGFVMCVRLCFFFENLGI